MLIESLDTACASDGSPPASVLAPRKEADQVTPSEPTQQNAETVLTDLSPVTLWMLAVRDERDKAAFGQLFDHFASRLKGFFMRQGSAAAEAEELVQEVMLTVWRRAGSFDPHRGQVSAWIYQIARNRQIDVIRKERRPVPEELREDPGVEPDAAHLLALEQEAGQLRQALGRLNPDQREMIEKAYLGELTHQEIAAVTGLPLGTIKSRIRLGLERLKHELKGMR